MRGKPGSVALLIGALGGMLTVNLAYGQVNAIVSAEERRIAQAQEGQDAVDEIVAATREQFDEYQGLLRQIENLEVYNRLQQNQIDDQNRELDQLRVSIDQVTVIERQVLPLMTRMIDGLEQFIALDVPFLIDERTERVEFLRTLLSRSDVTSAEQFRNVIEAWQIEMDYGAFPETYTAELQIDGTTREVDFLKIGRIALVYLTPDGQLAGAWDQRVGDWVELDQDYASEIRTGLRVVRTNSPEQFVIPVAPPEGN